MCPPCFQVNFLVLAAIDQTTEPKAEDAQPLLDGTKPNHAGYCTTCGINCHCGGSATPSGHPPEDYRRQRSRSSSRNVSRSPEFYRQITPQEERREARRANKFVPQGAGSRGHGGRPYEDRGKPYDDRQYDNRGMSHDYRGSSPPPFPGTKPRPSPRL